MKSKSARTPARAGPKPSLVDALQDPLPITPLTRPFEVAFRPPGSKSLSNRALVLAALAEGESWIEGLATGAEDVDLMSEALRTLGARIGPGDEPGSTIIVGRNGRLVGGRTLKLGNSGTATRFLTAVACLADAPVLIDGDERMRERPIGELVELLAQLGVRVEHVGAPGFPPLRVHPAKPVGGRVVVSSTRSSQFVSALMLLAPWTREGVDFRFEGPVTSPGYVEMTARLLSAVEGEDVCEGSPAEGWLRVGPPGLRSFNYSVEADASGATCLWAAAALFDGAEAVALGVPPVDSAQPDAGFVDVLVCAGAERVETDDGLGVRGGSALRGVTVDMTSMPDAAMALAAVACFASGPTVMTGLRTLRDKETDRIGAIQRELAKVGVRVEVVQRDIGHGVVDEGIVVTPPSAGVDCAQSVPRVEFDTYNDHRMAMSLALIGLRRPNVFVRDPACVRKTYASYWLDFASIHAPPA